MVNLRILPMFLLVACGDIVAQEEAPQVKKGSLQIDLNIKEYTNIILDEVKALEQETGLSIKSRDVIVKAQFGAIDCGGVLTDGCSRHRGNTTTIIVQVYDNCFANTAIGHELAHVALRAETGDGDGKHVDEIYWNSVKKVELAMQAKHCKGIK